MTSSSSPSLAVPPLVAPPPLLVVRTPPLRTRSPLPLRPPPAVPLPTSSAAPTPTPMTPPLKPVLLGGGAPELVPHALLPAPQRVHSHCAFAEVAVSTIARCSAGSPSGA